MRENLGEWKDSYRRKLEARHQFGDVQTGKKEMTWCGVRGRQMSSMPERANDLFYLLVQLTGLSCPHDHSPRPVLASCLL